MVGVFTPWKSANAINQVFVFSGRVVVIHLPLIATDGRSVVDHVPPI